MASSRNKESSKRCAYCDRTCQLTREHVIPRWYNDTPGENVTFNARVPLLHDKGDLVVKDVCKRCNGGPLGSLDGYGKELYERYFQFLVYEKESISFAFDGDRLVRWILKLSYNSARTHRADVAILRNYRNVMLGEEQIPEKISCWLHVVSPTWTNQETGELRVARRVEHGHPSVDEPRWFRICQLRMPELRKFFLVKRCVLINSFAFTLLIARSDEDLPCNDFEVSTKLFTKNYPRAKRILPGKGEVTIEEYGNHSIESIAPLFLNYTNRFGMENNPYVVQLLQSEREKPPIVLLDISYSEIQSGNVAFLSFALHWMVSTCEKATAFRTKIGIRVHGYDDAPRGLWCFLEVRKFFRQLFIECPFIMFLAHPLGALLKVSAACWVYEDDQTEEVERERLNDFVLRGFDALNDLNESIMLSEEQTREICCMAIETLCGERPPV